MTNIILCDVTASISELKNDPVATASGACQGSCRFVDSCRQRFSLRI